MADVLNRRLGFLIRLLHQIHLALFAEEREPFGVTPVQFSILSIAAARPGIEQGELADDGRAADAEENAGRHRACACPHHRGIAAGAAGGVPGGAGGFGRCGERLRAGADAAGLNACGGGRRGVGA